MLLDGDRAVLDTARHVSVDDLHKLVPDFGPDVVAIDAPPAWASSGRSRLTERELRWFGIQCFNTPSDPKMAEHPFYEWMTIGFQAFRVDRGRVPAVPQRFGEGLGDRGVPARDRGGAVGVPAADGHEPARVAADGPARAVGRRRQRSVRPTRSTPRSRRSPACSRSNAGSARPATRGRARSSCRPRPSPRARTAVPPPPTRAREQPSLPGLAACACGDPSCTALTGREFAPGTRRQAQVGAVGPRPAGAGRGRRAQTAEVGDPAGDAMSGGR